MLFYYCFKQINIYQCNAVFFSSAHQSVTSKLTTYNDIISGIMLLFMLF